MQKIPFVGASYIYDSLNFDSQRCVNFYPIRSESGTSRDEYALVPTAGLQSFSTLGTAETRGAWEVNGRAFFVSGNVLYEVYSDGTNEVRGIFFTSYSTPVSISDNGFQLCIVDGTATGGYIFTLDTNAFTQITDTYFLGATNVVFLGGYFVFNKPDSGIYYISSLYDGLSGDATEFAVAEGSPDNLIAIYALQNQLYLFGSHTTEINYVDGSLNFPLALVSGAFSEFGTTSPFAITSIGNNLFFIGSDKAGSAAIYKFNAYSPQKISTTPIDNILKKYDLTKATAYSYQEAGQYFICFNAPQMPTTLVYDMVLDLWHEKAFFNSSTGVYLKHLGQFHIFAFGKHLLGDYSSNEVYQQSLDFPDDNGTRIRRMRTLPYVIGTLNYIYFSKFQVDLESGTGLANGEPEDIDPKIYLDYSDDNGHTFKNGRFMKIGKLGEYTKRAISRMLGRGRSRVFRLTTSTRAKTFLIASYVDAEEGSN
jgi:hypothetical protein